MPELEDSDIPGIEAPLWSETLPSMKDLEYLAFPRILGLAELAWSPKGQSRGEYQHRLAPYGKRLEAMDIDFFRSPHIEWEK